VRALVLAAGAHPDAGRLPSARPGPTRRPENVYNIATVRLPGGRRLGPQFLEACGGRWAGIETALQDVRRRVWLAGVRDLQEFVAEIQARVSQAQCTATILGLIREQLPAPSPNPAGLEQPEAASEDPRAEIETLLEIATQYPGPAVFMAHVRGMQRRAQTAHQGKAVVLATIHKLKGQERSVVFGLGWCEAGSDKYASGLLPHTHSLQAARSGDLHAIEDERCLGFVLVSRAKAECHLSAPERYYDTAMALSRFVWELGVADGATPKPDEG
jgi:superfamily I DNA/RNA helicase